MPAQPEQRPRYPLNESQAPGAKDARAEAGGAPVAAAAGSAQEWRAAPKGLGRFWQPVCRWFQDNTFAPAWLPGRWQHPLVGALVGAALEATAVTIDLLLLQVFPTFQLTGILLLLPVLLVALTWGAGPSLISTLVGAALLNSFILTPRFFLTLHGAVNSAEDLFFVLVGLTLTIIATQTQRARREAERLAQEAQKARRNAEHLEEALRLSEREAAARANQLEAIFEAIGDGLAVYDAEGHMVRVNAAGRALLGLERLSADFTRLSFAERIPLLEFRNEQGQMVAHDQLPVLRALRGEALTGEHALELLTRTLDGHDVLIQSSTAPIRDAEGQIVGAVSAFRDVTERRRLAREVAERASQFQAIFEAIADAVVVYDRKGWIVARNTAALDLFSHLFGQAAFDASPEERGQLLQTRDVAGQPMPEAEWPIFRLLRGSVLQGMQAVDILVTDADGGEATLSISGAPVYDAEGQMVGAVAIWRDTTERQRLERRTHDALNGLLAIAEALVQAPDEPAPANGARRPGPNPVAQQLAALTTSVLGCKRLSLSALEPGTDLLRPVAVVGLPPEQEQRWWVERQSSRLSQSGLPDLIDRLLQGETVAIDFSKPPFNNQPNPMGVRTLLAAPMRLREQLVGLLLLDYGGEAHEFTPEEISLAGAVAKLGAFVLERERLLHEREEARASALGFQQANRQMDDFLGMASHELRTPLTSIMLGLQLAQRRYARLSGDKSELAEELSKKLAPWLDQMERVERQTKRLDRLVNDLLDVSRIQAGKLEVRPEPADLAAIVREAVEEERLAAPRRAILLHLAADQPIPAAMDADRIGQVITNYLTNALKYSEEACPVEVGVEVETDQARLWVRDQGPGIAPAELTRIWERFHRVPGIAVRSGSGVGLGLGLHISRAIIQQHHGQVGVESAVGMGSTFWFTLPLAHEAGD